MKNLRELKILLTWGCFFIIAIPFFICLAFYLFGHSSIGMFHLATPIISFPVYLIIAFIVTASLKSKPGYPLVIVFCFLLAFTVSILQLNVFIPLAYLFGVNNYALI